VAFVWGSTFVLVKAALEDISPVLFLALRFSIATVALGLLYVRRHGATITGRTWLGGIVTGAFLYTGYVFQTVGLRFTTPAKSGFITGMYIVLVPFFSALVYRNVPQISEVLGAAAATVGLVLLTWTGEALQISGGDLLTLCCAVAFAIHILILGHYSRRMDYEWLALVQIGTCAVIALSTFSLMEQPHIRSSAAVWSAVAITSIIATALAFSVQTWAQRFTTPMRTALIFALEPVFAWVTSFAVGGEVLTAKAVSGALLILAGILLVELKPIGRHEHRNSQT
jgi:drug/metabolite transporter (DMT)-like permease